MKLDFPTFYQTWGQMVDWEVPDFHLEVCDWLQHRKRLAVLKCFRGAAKSTIVGRYIPWTLKERPGRRFLVMSATNADAAKMSSDSQMVINYHPYLRGLRQKGLLWKTHQFQVEGSDDPRNPSVNVFGALSNMTGGRCDEAIFDDCEVPKTVATPHLRESLRRKISETTHILVPGGSKLYIGTDHCTNSIYAEQIERGADLKAVPLFAHETKILTTGRAAEIGIPWKMPRRTDLYCFIDGKLQEGYEIHGRRGSKGGFIRFAKPPAKDTTLHLYAGNAWPQRFTREEVRFKREECRSQNEWDSQYQLRAVTLDHSRLDPGRMIPYSREIEFRQVNQELTAWLGTTRLIGVNTWWDCSLGKKSSDASAVCVLFTDSAGYIYWHRAVGLSGNVDEQCQGVVRLTQELHLPNIDVETNGPGGFVPAILKRHLLTAGISCGVTPRWNKTQKNLRILDAWEPPLSGMFLHASDQVRNSPAIEQMQAWSPKTTDQPDDYLDAGAGAIAQTPVQIGTVSETLRDHARHTEWRPGGRVYDLAVDY